MRLTLWPFRADPWLVLPEHLHFKNVVITNLKLSCLSTLPAYVVAPNLGWEAMVRCFGPHPFYFLPTLFNKALFQMKITNPHPFYNFVSHLFSYFWFIQSCLSLYQTQICPSFTNHQWPEGELHHHYYPHCGSYFQGNLHSPVSCLYHKMLRGYCTPGPYFWRLCAFSQINKATSDKVSYGSGQKCSKEFKNHSFTSVETIIVKLQWKMCQNQYFPCFEP